MSQATLKRSVWTYEAETNLRKAHLHISKTMMFASEISTDLSSGRRPESKSVEISDANIIVFEILDFLGCNGRFLRFCHAGTL